MAEAKGRRRKGENKKEEIEEKQDNRCEEGSRRMGNFG